MSPILVRPVREQLEHDRLIRHLEGKYSKKKFDVAMNLGDEQVAPIRVAALTLYPDIVLTTAKKLAGVIEVETGESVNKLETMAQWVHFGKSKVPFHLYVPVPNYDAARRLCEAFQVKVAEIWTYRGVLDGFDLVRMFHDSAASAQPPRNAPAIPAAAKPVVVAPAPAPPKAPPPPAKPAVPAKIAAKPAAAKPVPAKPVATKPVAPKPVAAKPAAKPAAKKPMKPAAKPAAKPAVKAKAAAKAKPASKSSKPAKKKKR